MLDQGKDVCIYILTKRRSLDVTLNTGKLKLTKYLKKYLDQMKPMSGYKLYPGVENVYRD